MKRCRVIFKRGTDGKIKMYRNVDNYNVQEGIDWDSSTQKFTSRLHKTLECLVKGEQLVLDITIQSIPMR